MRVGSGGQRRDNQIQRADGSPMFGIGVDVEVDVGCGGGVGVGADTIWQPNWEGC